MSKYFMISEFAKLRNININSLRYYEKIGLLKPAYIDEQTNYRYYSPEQLYVLNQIILCKTIGIPLKEMVSYVDKNGNVLTKKLLEQGKILAEKKISEIQNNLNYIEYMLDSIESNKEFINMQGAYVRSFGERRIITTDYFSDKKNGKEIVSEIAKIYIIAEKEELYPILPAGMIVDTDSSGKIQYRFFLEIVSKENHHPQIKIVPKGDYICRQLQDHPDIDVFDEIAHNYNLQGKAKIIVDNISLEKFSFETRPTEIQILYMPARDLPIP